MLIELPVLATNQFVTFGAIYRPGHKGSVVALYFSWKLKICRLFFKVKPGTVAAPGLFVDTAMGN